MMAGKGIISLTHGNKDNHDLLNEMLSGSKICNMSKIYY